MPAPRWVARANRLALNRVTRLVAPWAPGWALVIHHGRRTGRLYRTPVLAFRRDDHLVVALTYGSRSDWVRNLLAAGSCEVETRRRHYHGNNPRVYRDDEAFDMPQLLRPFLRNVIKVNEFLSIGLEPKSAAGPT